MICLRSFPECIPLSKALEVVQEGLSGDMSEVEEWSDSDDPVKDASNHPPEQEPSSSEEESNGNVDHFHSPLRPAGGVDVSVVRLMVSTWLCTVELTLELLHTLKSKNKIVVTLFLKLPFHALPDTRLNQLLNQTMTLMSQHQDLQEQHKQGTCSYTLNSLCGIPENTPQ